MPPLLEVSQAQAIILEQVAPLPAVTLPLGPELLGLATADDSISDLDSPPFDKAMMDGYAVRAADLAGGEAEVTVIEEVLAGQVPTRPLGPGQATHIMTGAPIPAGADAVVMVERSTKVREGRVRLSDRARVEQNILRRGREMREGELVVPAGTRLRPEEIGLLAAVGRAHVPVHPRPTVALIPTGDEIVDVEHKPGPGQIRNTNGQMLLAQIARADAVPRWLGIARDDETHLRALISDGLRSDVLVLSGGVSAGKVDLVPRVLAELGVEILLHRVRMKPGKPMLFGKKAHADRPPTYVFGLPGNPVSSLVCFEIFVRPALRRLKNLPPGPVLVRVPLGARFDITTDRPTYHPARVEETPAGGKVQAVPWFGSPDLRGVMKGNAFAVFEPGSHSLAAGQEVPVLLVDTHG